VIENLIKKFGKEAVDDGHCIIHFDENAKTFREMFQRYALYDTVIEIGTNRGITAALLSCYAKRVITIDIELNDWCFKFWKYLKRDNISYFVYKPEDIYSYLENETFDFAFIDGDHTGNFPRNDFEAVKKCGKVLFHDYFLDKRFPAVNEVINSLEGHLWIKEPYVLWRAE